MKILKCLYGLKQAAFEFKDHLDKTLTAMGFRRLCCNASVYLGSHKENKIILTSHVDDLLFLSTDIDGTQGVFNELSKTYSMTFQAHATEYLGYTIVTKKKDQIVVPERRYLETAGSVSSQVIHKNSKTS